MLTFFLENRIWPIVHTRVNAALYIATGRPLLCFFLACLWEVFERLVMRRLSAKWGEAIDDSLIGDPLVAALIILALWLIDVSTGWGQEFRALVPWYIRLLQFIAVAGAITAVAVFVPESSVNLQIFLIGLADVNVTLAFYLPYVWTRLFDSVGRQMLLWIYVGSVLNLLCLLPGKRFPFSTFMRVVFVEATFLGAALLTAMIYFTNRNAKSQRD